MAGSKSGKALMGLSLKRAGNTHIAATGCPAPVGQSPTTVKTGGFNSPGTTRAGDNTVMATGRPGAAGECPMTCGDCK